MLKNRNIPFGYRVINGKYALNVPEAEAVRNIFAEYIGGKALKAIAAEMKIPYNSGKDVWNINMVCRVLENTKYLGNDRFPRIISNKDFETAAQIKAGRNTYRKPAPQDIPRQFEITATEYAPTEEVQRMTDEINRLLNSENTDKDKVEALIIRCAQLKYMTICEVRT